MDQTSALPTIPPGYAPIPPSTPQATADTFISQLPADVRDAVRANYSAAKTAPPAPPPPGPSADRQFSPTEFIDPVSKVPVTTPSHDILHLNGPGVAATNHMFARAAASPDMAPPASPQEYRFDWARHKLGEGENLAALDASYRDGFHKMGVPAIWAKPMHDAIRESMAEVVKLRQSDNPRTIEQFNESRWTTLQKLTGESLDQIKAAAVLAVQKLPTAFANELGGSGAFETPMAFYQLWRIGKLLQARQGR